MSGIKSSIANFIASDTFLFGGMLVAFVAFVVFLYFEDHLYIFSPRYWKTRRELRKTWGAYYDENMFFWERVLQLKQFLQTKFATIFNFNKQKKTYGTQTRHFIGGGVLYLEYPLYNFLSARRRRQEERRREEERIRQEDNLRKTRLELQKTWGGYYNANEVCDYTQFQ